MRISSLLLRCGLTFSLAVPAAAQPRPLVTASDCQAEQQAMRDLGFDEEIAEQLNEPNRTPPGRFEEYLSAFRGGLKASHLDGDEAGVASYSLSFCAFRTAALRASMAAQSAPAPNGGVAAQSSPPPSATTNSGERGNQGFVAPPPSGR